MGDIVGNRSTETGAETRVGAHRSSRDLGIDTLRGVACILVVLYHVRGSGPEHGLRLESGNPWSYFVDSLVYLRMPLFTFLSGTVYALRPCRAGYGAFARGKARRLLIPMLVIGTLFAVTQRFADDGDPVRPWYLWHIYPVGHFWFLESIVVVFLLVGVLDRFHLLDRLSLCVGMVAVLVALDVIVPQVPNVLGLRMALYLAPFFIAGVAASRFDWCATPLALRITAAAGAVALIVVTQLGLQGVLPRVPERHSVIAAALGILSCLTLLAVRRPVRWLAWIGGFSFTIYLCHVFGTAAARMVLHRAGIDQVAVNMIVGLIAGLAVGIVIELLARRSRLGRFLVLGQRFRRRQRAGVSSEQRAA
jgi:fucose 4-O-acetylase-like acetyltransferase